MKLIVDYNDFDLIYFNGNVEYFDRLRVLEFM
jgi:hypothetical protein